MAAFTWRCFWVCVPPSFFGAGWTRGTWGSGWLDSWYYTGGYQRLYTLGISLESSIIALSPSPLEQFDGVVEIQLAKPLAKNLSFAYRCWAVLTRGWLGSMPVLLKSQGWKLKPPNSLGGVFFFKSRDPFTIKSTSNWTIPDVKIEVFGYLGIHGIFCVSLNFCPTSSWTVTWLCYWGELGLRS